MDWKPVLDPRYGGYWPAFDRGAVYEFKRAGDDKVSTFRMADQNPFFNIAGLLWREGVGG